MRYFLPTSSAEHLGKRIQEEIRKRNLSSVKVIFSKLNKDNQRYFPDGEVYSCLPEAEEGLFNNQQLVLLHSGQPKPNSGLRELEYLLEIIQHYSSPQKIDLFFTYLPYSRQDKKFQSGEIPKIEKDFDKFYQWYKVNQIYVIDAHFARRKHWDYQKRPFFDVKGYPVIIEKIEEDFPGKELLFLAPDLGAQLRFRLPGTCKERKDSYNLTLSSEEDLIHKIKKYSYLVALDDLSETGNTLLRFWEFCKKHNSRSTLIAALTHGVSQKGIDCIRKVYDYLYLGNTIHRREANVDFTELILKTFTLL